MLKFFVNVEPYSKSPRPINCRTERLAYVRVGLSLILLDFVLRNASVVKKKSIRIISNFVLHCRENRREFLAGSDANSQN